MTTWLPRGLVFAAGMVLLRLVQGTLINTYPTKAGLISVALVVLFAVAALVWALLDGVADARANPDPDRRRDLAMRWLLAGLFAGVLSGLAVWAISLFYRTRPPQERRRVTDGVESDVFDAVRDDEPRTGPIPVVTAATAGAAAIEYPEDYPSAVALAEREVYEDETEQIVGQIRDETERIETEIDEIVSEDDTKY